MNLVYLSHSLDFGFRGRSGYRNSFCQSRLFTVTLQPCRLSLKCKVMFLAWSSVFFNHASTSVNGCYLYIIIIHYGMWKRDWGIRLVPRGGRPDSESFKAIDTYTYSKNHTNSPYILPGCVKIVQG